MFDMGFQWEYCRRYGGKDHKYRRHLPLEYPKHRKGELMGHYCKLVEVVVAEMLLLPMKLFD